MTALEDVFYCFWKEAASAGERGSARFQAGRSHRARRPPLAFSKREARKDEQATTGYPLRRIPASSGSPLLVEPAVVFLASQRLFLVPGDSPIGYRLPLDSLPWTKPEDAEWSFDPDPFRQAR